MATSCYFELDQCGVFLGNDALMNVNWQNKRPFSAPIHSMRPEHIVTQGSDCSGLQRQDWLTINACETVQENNICADFGGFW